jgi:ERF superfamily
MGIASKMVAAMATIDAVEKHGENTFQKYKYVRAADVANEVRKAMIVNGIAFTYDVVDAQHWESTKEGKSTNYFCQLTVSCTFTDSETGESFSGRVVSWGSDTLDKAPFKAMTGAIKYAMRMNFMIPDESDPENDSKEVVERTQVVRAEARASTLKSQLVASIEEDDIDQYLGNPDVEAYNAAYNPPAPKKASGPVITEAQAKRLYAIAMSNAWTKDDLDLKLAEYGVKRSTELPKANYDEACAWAARQ